MLFRISSEINELTIFGDSLPLLLVFPLHPHFLMIPRQHPFICWFISYSNRFSAPSVAPRQLLDMSVPPLRCQAMQVPLDTLGFWILVPPFTWHASILASRFLLLAHIYPSSIMSSSLRVPSYLWLIVVYWLLLIPLVNFLYHFRSLFPDFIWAFSLLVNFLTKIVLSFTSTACFIHVSHTGKILGQGRRRHGIYYIDFICLPSSSFFYSCRCWVLTSLCWSLASSARSSILGSSLSFASQSSLWSCSSLQDVHMCWL